MVIQKKISVAQCKSAIDKINQDYSASNSNINDVVTAFKGKQTNCEIQFRLATKAPNGKCFTGAGMFLDQLLVEFSTDCGQKLVNGGIIVFRTHYPPTKLLVASFQRKMNGKKWLSQSKNPFW